MINFKPLEFEGFKKQAGLNSFLLIAKKWIETTNAIGKLSESGFTGLQDKQDKKDKNDKK